MSNQRNCRTKEVSMTRRIIVIGLSVFAVVSCGTDSELPAATATPVTTAPPTTTAVVTLPVVIDDNSGDVAATTTPDAETNTSPSTAPVSTSAPAVIVVKESCGTRRCDHILDCRGRRHHQDRRSVNPHPRLRHTRARRMRLRRSQRVPCRSARDWDGLVDSQTAVMTPTSTTVCCVMFWWTANRSA